MDIKKLKPKRSSHYQQGSFNPATAKKLFESQKGKPIIYRSSWERSFILWLERSSKVKRWGSECIKIEYYNPVKGKVSEYFPDFVVEMTDGKIMLIEIKPISETRKPNPKSKYAVDTYIRNQAKWKAAKEFCERNDFHFSILTEHTIEHLKYD